MKKIKLICLDLNNFKCFRHLKLDFNGRNAVIHGDNAVGKTTIFDAFAWVLFSKSSIGSGDKNFEVKPIGSDGNVLDHNALTSVEVVLDVNGERLTLCRTYREKWETRRGSSEAVFTGNTSEYTIDGVPVKRNAFQDKVNELVDEDTFRLFTNTTYFAGDLSWQERRAELFKVAGVMDDGQIMATNEQFAPLIESMGRLSLEDYKKKLLAEKRKFVGAKTEIPARISECAKTIEDVEGLDFAGAKLEVEALQVKQDSISAQIVAIEHDRAADQKRMEIREAQLELSKLDAENKAYRDSQSTGNVDTKILHQNFMVQEMGLKNKTDALSSAEKVHADYDRRIDESRSRWISVNGERFTANSCPTCGQKLPADQTQEAENAFERNKKLRLSEIEQTANALKQAKADTASRIENLRKEISELETGIADVKNRISAAEASRVEPKDMDGYADSRTAIEARINSLSGELADISQSSYDVKEKLRKEKEEISLQIAEKLRIVNKESLLEYSRNRIEELRRDAKNTAECLEAIESMLWLIDEYSRYKTRFVEDSINGMFRIARFRLFREQANGGIEDRCDVMYDGIAYENLNNSMKINLGIDIINTLSVAYGVRVPLFVDNAESVTNLESSSSQIIRLVVSENDKELRVNYEN